MNQAADSSGTTRGVDRSHTPSAAILPSLSIKAAAKPDGALFTLGMLAVLPWSAEVGDVCKILGTGLSLVATACFLDDNLELKEEGDVEAMVSGRPLHLLVLGRQQGRHACWGGTLSIVCPAFEA